MSSQAMEPLGSAPWMGSGLLHQLAHVSRILPCLSFFPDFLW